MSSKINVWNKLRSPSTLTRSSVALSRCQTPCPPFTVVPCTCCDEDRVMDFMARTFFREEPVLVATGLACLPEPPPVLLEHTRHSFREGLSLMAVHNGQQDVPDTICGVAINGIIVPDDACELTRLAGAPIPQFNTTKYSQYVW